MVSHVPRRVAKRYTVAPPGCGLPPVNSTTTNVPTPTNGSVPQGEPWYKKDPSRMTKNQRNKRNKHFREQSRQAARAAMVPGVDYDSYYSDTEDSNDDGWTDQLEDYAGPVLFKPDALNEVPYKTGTTAPTDSTPDEPMLD